MVRMRRGVGREGRFLAMVIVDLETAFFGFIN
jgi:hypothetical protein